MDRIVCRRRSILITLLVCIVQSVLSNDGNTAALLFGTENKPFDVVLIAVTMQLIDKTISETIQIAIKTVVLKVQLICFVLLYFRKKNQVK